MVSDWVIVALDVGALVVACPKCGMNEEDLIQELIELHERNCKGRYRESDPRDADHVR